MLKMIASLAVLSFLVTLGISNYSYAQKSIVSNKVENLADTRLQNVQIQVQSIESLFSTISLTYDIPIGLEVESNDDELDAYKVEFKEGTLSELLNKITDDNPHYTWEIKDGVINVFPKESYRDASFIELLETKISNFSVKENTNCWTLIESLISTPEIKKVLLDKEISYRKRSFSGVYIPQVGRNFTLNVSDMTLKSIINNVVKESKIAKFWVIKRNNYNPQTFFISLGARYEDLPTDK